MREPDDRPEAVSRSARRGSLDVWFRDVKVPPEAGGDLLALAHQGSVVFVVRRAGFLSFLFLSWLCRAMGLPPLRAALGLGGPLRLLTGIRSSQRALEVVTARGHCAVVFLQGGKGPDPFPLLAAMQRRRQRPLFLVPALLVWSRRPQKLERNVADILFGAPEAPNRLANAIGFLKNRKRAFLRLGRPIHVSEFLRERPSDGDAVLGRLMRGSLHLHLARQFRAAVGPPIKSAARVNDQVLRDRGLRRALDREARETGRPPAALLAEARKDLEEVASRFSPGLIELIRPLVGWFLRRTFESLEVDEPGLDRVKRAAAEAPLVLCPSHKSHVDYLFLSWLFYENGLTPPHIAAGINLAFWPFGRIARMGGAFFIRRTVRGDRIYTAVLRSYVKQLLRDRFPQEFFLEGGRSRTGKLLFPKTGLFSMEVDAWLDGAADDVLFVPVAVDYEQLMEAGSYARELAGGEKRKENLGGLWRARRVLGRKHGRLHVQFEEPVSLRELARQRLGAGASALAVDDVMQPHEATAAGGGSVEKRELVQALANRVAYGIAKATTVTPVGLLAAALLSHPRRGLPAQETARRVELLRDIAVREGARFARGLAEAPGDPRQPGPMAAALGSLAGQGLVRVEEAAGDFIYLVPEERRPQLDFHRNAVLHRFVGLSLVAAALRAGGAGGPRSAVEERARFLSRLFKLEFMYRVGSDFGDIFRERLGQLVELGAAAVDGAHLSPGPARETLDFLADLTRAYLESYRVTVETAAAALAGGAESDRKALVKLTLDKGRAAYLAGRIALREAVSKATVENAVEWLVQRGALAETGGKLRPSSDWHPEQFAALLGDIDRHLA